MLAHSDKRSTFFHLRSLGPPSMLLHGGNADLFGRHLRFACVLQTAKTVAPDPQTATARSSGCSRSQSSISPISGHSSRATGARLFETCEKTASSSWARMASSMGSSSPAGCGLSSNDGGDTARHGLDQRDRGAGERSEHLAHRIAATIEVRWRAVKEERNVCADRARHRVDALIARIDAPVPADAHDGCGGIGGRAAQSGADGDVLIDEDREIRLPAKGLPERATASMRSSRGSTPQYRQMPIMVAAASVDGPPSPARRGMCLSMRIAKFGSRPMASPIATAAL